MRRNLLHFSFFLSSISALFSQNYKTETIFIQDSLEKMSEIHSDYTVLKADSLNEFLSSGINSADIIGKVEGVNIKNYGGHGGVKTVSIRGFASNQTTFSINDIPMQNPQSGVLNLSNIQLSGFQSIRVQQASAAPTQNILGGNINFLTDFDKNLLKFGIGIGSFGEKIGNFRIQQQVNRTKFSADYNFISAKDNFPFDINEEKSRRTNADFLNHQYNFLISHQFSKQIKLTLHSIGTYGKQNIPGPVVKGNIAAFDEKIEQFSNFHYIKLDFSPEKLKNLFRVTQWNLSLKHHFNLLNYYFRDSKNVYESHDWLLQNQTRHLLGKNILKTVVQMERTQLNGNNLSDSTGSIGFVYRNQANFALQAERFFEFEEKTLHYLHFSMTSRLNYSTDFEVLPNFSLQIHSKFWKKNSLEIFTHLSHGNRIPSFNELYYRGFGNASLKSEQVQNADFGGIFSIPQFFKTKVKILAFANTVKNKIIAVPLSPVRWSTQAIAKTKTLGIEVSSHSKIGEFVEISYNYTLMEAEDISQKESKLIPYTPRETINCSATFSKKKFSLGADFQYISWRFSNLANTKSGFLASYCLANAFVNYRIKFKQVLHDFKLSVQNFLNENYQILPSYPMPGRSFRATYSMFIL